MLRIVVIVAALTAFPAASFAAHRADTPASASGSLVTKVVSCDVSSTAHAATFYGRMDTIAGASKMQMRFQLLEKLGRDDTFSKIDVPALKAWRTSQAGVKRYGWKQIVDGLHIGGAYKSRVTFRWLSASGAVLDTATRDTPVCRGPLPNIAVGDLSVKPGPTNDTRSYRVDIQNTGKIDADEVEVQLAVDKAILDTVTLNHLAAGDTRTVSFTGPVCSHGVRVFADPGNSIGETLEDDNSQRFACP
jgi:CARDB